ncbi:outer membrane protein [Qipengyuania sphaerica]|uniref:outer membrane protein n=1 Tax=Qipengyuania sphaerica TaxID=2867243 RepID=UPI001C888159|nr:outer membrane beta-barrel protein [Qipengyuania sphaerica]MBX7541404.1 outer membrane beta-barrel protein [Qipengyuania sphaerica]
MKKIVYALAMAGVAMPGAAFAQDAYADEGEEWAAPAENKAGFRIEARGFYERIDDPDEDAGIRYEFGNGFGAGVEAGFDIAVGETVVVGPYATYDFSGLETCEGGLCFAAPEYWAVGAHIGIATGDAGQIYGKLGYGQQTVTVEGSFVDPFDGPVTLDETETKGGYNFAFGYEHGFGDTIYARGELGVSESYDIYGFDLQRGLFAIALGARF